MFHLQMYNLGLKSACCEQSQNHLTLKKNAWGLFLSSRPTFLAFWSLEFKFVWESYDENKKPNQTNLQMMRLGVKSAFWEQSRPQ